MIGSREPAHWDGPPTRLCFLESLEVSPSVLGNAIIPAPGPWTIPATGFNHARVRSDLGLRLALAAKRLIDLMGGILGLLISAPVIGVAAALIRLDDRGPVFFAQDRSGRDGRVFRMWKLRSMQPDAEERQAEFADRNRMDGPVFKIDDDPRVTPVGHFLRRFSLDELPQFLNVIRGDMSLVGPRPPLPSEVAKYTLRQRRRLAVKPGLTCTWQVSGRNNINFEEWVRLDLDYIDRWSLRRDLSLIARTLPAMIRGDGAS